MGSRSGPPHLGPSAPHAVSLDCLARCLRSLTKAWASLSPFLHSSSRRISSPGGRKGEPCGLGGDTDGVWVVVGVVGPPLHTAGFRVGEGEARLGHPSRVGLVLIGIQARQVAQGEEGLSLQVVGPQGVVVEDGEQQTGPVLAALLGGDEAAGWDTGGHLIPSCAAPILGLRGGKPTGKPDGPCCVSSSPPQHQPTQRGQEVKAHPRTHCCGVRMGRWGLLGAEPYVQLEGFVKEGVQLVPLALGAAGHHLWELMPGLQGELHEGVTGAWRGAAISPLLPGGSWASSRAPGPAAGLGHPRLTPYREITPFFPQQTLGCSPCSHRWSPMG